MNHSQRWGVSAFAVASPPGLQQTQVPLNAPASVASVRVSPPAPVANATVHVNAGQAAFNAARAAGRFTNLWNDAPRSREELEAEAARGVQIAERDHAARALLFAVSVTYRM